MIFISSLRVLSDSRLYFHKFVPSNKVSIRKMYSLKIIFQATERDEICENISVPALSRSTKLAIVLADDTRYQAPACSIVNTEVHCTQQHQHRGTPGKCRYAFNLQLE